MSFLRFITEIRLFHATMNVRAWHVDANQEGNQFVAEMENHT